MMTRILHWVREDDSGLGREKLAGNMPVSSLAVPMMLLCLVDQLTTMDPALAANYDETEQWCLKEVAKHVQVGLLVLLLSFSFFCLFLILLILFSLSRQLPSNGFLC